MGKLFLILAALLFLFALLFYFNPSAASRLTTATQPAQQVHSTQDLNAALYQKVQQDYDAKLTQIENAFKRGELSVEEAARRREDARIALEHDRGTVANPIRNCPDDYHWEAKDGRPIGLGEVKAGDDENLVFDVTACASNIQILLQWPNQYKTVTITGHLYKYGQNRQLVEIAPEPDISLFPAQEHDGFSIAERVSPYTVKVRGNFRLTLHGDADVVKLSEVHVDD